MFIVKEHICEVVIGIKPNFNQFRIKVPLNIPSSDDSSELAVRICSLHNIPISLHEALRKELKAVIEIENEKYFSFEDEKLIEDLKTGSLDVKSLSEFWDDKYYWSSSNEYSSPSPSDDLPSLYHSLIHSPSVTSLVSLEHSFSDAVSKLVDKKKKAMHELSQCQSGEMESAVESVGSILSAEDVTSLASSHVERNQMEEVTWDSELSALKEEQKRSFQSFVREAGRGREIGTPLTPKEFAEPNPGIPESIPIQEESFTIHLGTQMKQMHNLRIMATDVASMCNYSNTQSDSSCIPPQRFQTSMNLYSHNLSGLVVLVDDRVNTYTGMKNEFGNICNRSPELHFSDFECQLEKVRNFVPQLCDWRDNDSSSNEVENASIPASQTAKNHLKMGDVYISKHSNLAEIHTVFHLVVDDSLRSGDINSRHSVIMGLRNVLKVACLADITTLTVPLLLTHKLTEEMTIPWCQKRAELVFKCLKGFMIEMSSWGGAEMKNLQFMLPKGISDDLFQSLCSMLQSIFRLSNTLVVKTRGN